MAGKKSTRYTEEFKKTIVNLRQNGKSYAEIKQEYGVSHSGLAKWIKQYSIVKLDDDTLITLSRTRLCKREMLSSCERNTGGCHSGTRRIFRRNVSYGSGQSVYGKEVQAVSGSA